MRLAIVDGVVFYTHELEGRGAEIFLKSSIGACVSLTAIIFTFVAWKANRPWLHLPHFIWQVGIELQAKTVQLGIVVLSVRGMFAIYKRSTMSPKLPNDIATPSAIVFLVALSSIIFLECWW